jgi:prepilin-type N-terminal cleavage/methylation domain-containing protein
MKNIRLSKGFTLIELLIVITIIGILAVALLPSVLGAPARARDAARKADLNNIIAALETYNSDNQKYPDTDICFDGTTTTIDAYFQGGKAPNDPQGKGLGGTTTETCKGYYYCPLDGNPASYGIGAYMEILGDASSGDILTGATCDGSADPPASVAKTDGDQIFLVVK